MREIRQRARWGQVGSGVSMGATTWVPQAQVAKCRELSTESAVEFLHGIDISGKKKLFINATTGVWLRRGLRLQAPDFHQVQLVERTFQNLGGVTQETARVARSQLLREAALLPACIPALRCGCFIGRTRSRRGRVVASLCRSCSLHFRLLRHPRASNPAAPKGVCRGGRCPPLHDGVTSRAVTFHLPWLG